MRFARLARRSLFSPFPQPWCTIGCQVLVKLLVVWSWIWRLRKGEKSALFCTGLQLQCRDGNAFILIVSTIEFESTNGCVSQILSDLLHSPVKILLFFIANQPGIRGICCILITNQHPCSDIPKHATAASAKIYPTFFYSICENSTKIVLFSATDSFTVLKVSLASFFYRTCSAIAPARTTDLSKKAICASTCSLRTAVRQSGLRAKHESKSPAPCSSTNAEEKMSDRLGRDTNPICFIVTAFRAIHPRRWTGWNSPMSKCRDREPFWLREPWNLHIFYCISVRAI